MKVKLTGFWEDDTTLFNTFVDYGFGNPVWKDMELVPGGEYDRLVILTRPHFHCKDYDQKKAITLLTEPPESPNIMPHETSAVIPVYLPLPFWQHFGSRDWALLQAPEVGKSALLSSVTSELSYLEGHKARLQLISLLDKSIADGFDLWGRRYDNRFFKDIACYKGNLKNKYDALWPYQYHFACENSFIDNYFTEKIADPILAECLCFYDGCLNIEAYIDERAFIKIDVFDPLSAIQTIISAIEAHEWDKRVGYIRRQKARLLNELNPLNIIWLAVKGRDVQRECML